MNAISIVLIDDDEDIHHLVQVSLGSEFHICSFKEIQKAKEYTKRNIPALFLIDEELPDGSGTEYIRELRKDPEFEFIPIFMLTYKNDVTKKLLAFNAGVDDYILKPLEPLDLLARVKNRLRYFRQIKQVQKQFIQEDLKFDLTNFTTSLIQADQEQTLGLTPFEFLLLLYLAKHEGRIFHRNELYERFWKERGNVSDRTIDQHMARIRKKLKNSALTIKNTYSIGYGLVKKVA